MNLSIPADAVARLRTHAAAAGYADVERCVTDHVIHLASQPSNDELPPMSESELQASLAMIDRSMAEFEAGKGMSLDEARRASLERLRTKPS